LNDISWFAVVAGLVGGLGLFLLGLRQLTEALKEVAGGRLTSVLAGLTTNRIAGVGTGILVTAVVQSSSVTTVLAVGFVSAGAMTFHQTIGVVLGANVGTTITAQAIAFDIRVWALLLVGVGALGLLSGRSGRWEVRSTGVLGLGLVFLGMQVMAEAVSPLRDQPAVLDLLASLELPVLGLAAGAVFTALVQSSSATTALVLTLAGSGLVTLPAGVAILVGANVGSCATAVVAAVGKPVGARRVAAFHVLVNLAGAALWVGFLGTLVSLAEAVTPGGAGEDLPRTLANAHTIFNVSVLLVLLPLAKPASMLVERLLPDRAVPGGPEPGTRLDSGLLSTPALALAAVRSELHDMGDDVSTMLADVPGAVLDGTTTELDALAAADDAVDRRYRAVVGYLAEVGREPLAGDVGDEFVALLAANDALENAGDIVETNLVALGRRRIEEDITIAAEGAARIRRVHAEVLTALRSAVRALVDEDDAAAAEVLHMRSVVHPLIDDALDAGATAIASGTIRHLRGYELEVDILENLRRVLYFARRLARARLGPADPRTDPSAEEPSGTHRGVG